jgi:hypothetical protein
MGVRFQRRPGEEPSEIIMHVHLLDQTALGQQEALGILGVNLVHGARFSPGEPAVLIGSLMDALSRDRADVDMIKFSGPAFSGLDNRLMSLQLVEQGLTDAAMFTAAGEVVQPSEVLYKKPVLAERGSFRPATKLTLDLLERARDQFLEEPEVRGKQIVVLAEMTLHALSSDGTAEIDHRDFLDRAQILGALGIDALVSRFGPYYELADYLSSYTDGLIGLAVGLPALRQIADEKYYKDLPGGVLESAGKLFKRSVKMYVYPTGEAGKVMTVDVAPTAGAWGYLRDFLIEIGRIVPIRGYDESLLSTRTPEVLSRIQAGDPSWEGMVPLKVAEIIKEKKLFGFGGQKG